MLAVAVAMVCLGSTPALESLVERVVEGARFDTLEAPVGLWVYEEGDAGLALHVSAMLQRRLAQARLAPTLVDARDGIEADRTARAQRLRALVRVTVSQDNSGLRARGDIVSTWTNFWSGANQAEASAALSTFDLRVQDAALATLTRPWSLSPWLQFLTPPLALANLGSGKLAVAFRDEVKTYAWGAERPVAWLTLMPVPENATPARDPVARFEPLDGGFRLWNSTLANAARIDLGQTPSVAVDSTVDAGAPGSPIAGRNAFAPDALREAPWTNSSTACGARLDVYEAGAAVVTFGGAKSRIVAGAGSMVWEGAGQRCWLLTTSPKVAGASDELRIFAVDHGTVAPQPLTTLLLSEGAALVTAAGDFDGDGVVEVAVGVERSDRSGAVWLLRAGAP